MATRDLHGADLRLIGSGMSRANVNLLELLHEVTLGERGRKKAMDAAARLRVSYLAVIVTCHSTSQSSGA